MSAHPCTNGGRRSCVRSTPAASQPCAITVDSVKHVSYPFPGMTVDRADDSGFSVSGDTPAGLLTVTLDGTVLAYTVGDGTLGSYHFGDLVCDSVTYWGTAD